jgi:tetratricopeptide (TPR) repeat protein
MTEDQKIELALRRHEESFELKAAGDLAGAEGACREALALFEEVDGKEHPDTANVLQCLGAILDRQCRYDEAEECGRRAVAIMDKVAGLVEGPEAGLILIQALGVLGTALRQKGLYADAETVLKRAIALAEEHPDGETLPIALNNLGIVYKYSGNFDEAVRLYTRALRLTQEAHGEQNAMAATLYHNLGGLEHARGRYADGEAPARRAWEIRREMLGEEHPDALADACAYGGVLDGLERYAESRPIYENALAIYERVFGPEHFEVAATLHNLAGVESAMGEEE